MSTQKLNLEDLNVETFSTSPDEASSEPGTVRGYASNYVGCTDMCNDSYGGCSGAGCTGETICETCDGCNTLSCGYYTGCDVLPTCDTCDTQFTADDTPRCNEQGTWAL
jgi:hypothetical protein